MYCMLGFVPAVTGRHDPTHDLCRVLEDRSVLAICRKSVVF